MDAPRLAKLAPVMIGTVLGVAGWLLGREVAAPGTVNIPARKAEAAQNDFARDDAGHAERERESARLLRAQWPEVISECLAEPSAPRRLQRFYELTQGLEMRDFPAFMELLRSEKDLGLRGELFEVWAERDLKNARAWFDTQPAKERSPFGTRLVAVWGRIDVSALGSWISGLPADERKALAPMHDLTWRELAALAAERNPEATLDLLATIPEAESSCQAIAIRALVRRDPAAAAARTLAMPTGGGKNAAFNALVTGWMKTNPAAALEWFGQLDDPEKATWARSIAALESAKGSEREFAKALEAVPPDGQYLVRESRASALVQIAPGEAIAFARGYTDPILREAMMTATLREISSFDPARAAELWLAETAQTGRAPRNGGALISALAEKHGAAAALRFIQSVPPGQAAALKDVPMSLAQAVGWAAVADAAVQMPPGAGRTEWLQQSVSALTRDGDLAAAEQLTARLPAGRDRETAVRAMGAAVFSENPDTGAKTLLRLADGRAALGQEVQRWMKADAPEARRWISTTAFMDASEKAELLSPATGSR